MSWLRSLFGGGNRHDDDATKGLVDRDGDGIPDPPYVAPPPPTAEDYVQAAKWSSDKLFLEIPSDNVDETRPLTHAMRQHRAKYGSVSGMGAGIAPAIVNMLIPPILFTIVYTMMCFKYHYTYPRAVWLVACAGLLPIFYLMEAMRRARRNPGADLRWYRLSIGLLALAEFLALLAGELVFWFFFYNYYHITSMKTYTNISPAEVTGQRLMDAGIVHFAESTRLATDMGMSFTNWDVYCVAPIVIPGVEQASYDLWAVGINCCRSEDPVFNCGETSNPMARAGLRQASEEHRLFFRLAVQQAEAAYNIQSNHPIFFYWTQDPTHDVDEFFIAGFKHWMMLVMLHFCVNAAIIVFFYTAFRPNRAPASLHTVGQ